MMLKLDQKILYIFYTKKKFLQQKCFFLHQILKFRKKNLEKIGVKKTKKFV